MDHDLGAARAYRQAMADEVARLDPSATRKKSPEEEVIIALGAACDGAAKLAHFVVKEGAEFRSFGKISHDRFKVISGVQREKLPSLIE
jgi:hypothetical protein